MSHPTGNANVRAALSGLQQRGLLAEFATAIAVFPDDVLDRLGRFGALTDFRRRGYEPALQPLTTTWPWSELARLLATKAGFSSLVQHERGRFSVDAVYHNLDKRLASTLTKGAQNGASAVYAYEDGAAYSFQRAKQLGMQCLYDLPIGYWKAARRLLEAERERWPDWTPTLTGFRDSETKLDRKDEELRLADHIFVASQFTAQTLRNFSGRLAPVHVIPYGFPPVTGVRAYAPITAHKPLKLLFVGGLSQRKGIADLFSVVEKFGPHVTLTVVGRKASDNCPALDQALSRHHWIPSLPHDGVLQLMREHDVFVFPSLFEGFGLVITEAMSQGTPVITTERTAGPDLIRHGHNGWLIEAGSTQGLEQIIDALRRHPAAIAEAGANALQTARERPWSVYGTELAAAVSAVL